MLQLLNRIKAWLRTPQLPPPMIASAARQTMPLADDAHAHLVPFDENLLERSRTQWQFGDWASLANLDRDTLQHHPDRAKLALLAAAGHQGLGNAAEARQLTRLAIDWGCSKKLVTQILISGVHNTLGRAAAVSGQEQRAQKHFHASIEVGASSSAVGLLTQARVSHQLLLIGLPAKELSIVKPANVNIELITKKNSVAEPRLDAQEKTELAKGIQDQPQQEYSSLVHSCIASDDLHESVKKTIVTHKLTNNKLFYFLLEVSDQLVKAGDKLTALSYLNQGRISLMNPSVDVLTVVAKRMLKLGQFNAAQEIFFQAALDGKGILPLSEQELASLKNANLDLLKHAAQKSAHGHDLLLAEFSKNLTQFVSHISDRKPVLIEIGTTREDVPGQGSTKLLADYCKANSLDFITVDMDPRNSEMAKQTFSALDATDFQAITSKGEDYLRDYEGPIDFIFLDAYDFDHGKHSELRQSRYKKFLGARIDEVECHRMHLDCAQSVAKKLSPLGLVCFDDTWLEDGKWTAKGTLGMPFLLANGFEVVEARNRAALLRRIAPTQAIQLPQGERVS